MSTNLTKRWDLPKRSVKPVSFLDISVSINGDTLPTSVSYKPTGSQSYLLFLTQNTVKDPSPRYIFQCLLMAILSQRQFLTAPTASRNDLLHYNAQRDTGENIPLVFTYHPFKIKVNEVVKRNFRIVQNDPETLAIFTDPPLTAFLVPSTTKQAFTGSTFTFSCTFTVILALFPLSTFLVPSLIIRSGISFHVYQVTSFIAWHAINILKFISVKLPDPFLRGLPNFFVWQETMILTNL